jgi:nuclear pore complex protein Nup88
VDGGAGRRAVGFAFGPAASWGRFAVFFLASDGALFTLCPVAPFGAAVPPAAAQALLDAAAVEAEASGGAGQSATTLAWLQQVTALRVCQ